MLSRDETTAYLLPAARPSTIFVLDEKMRCSDLSVITREVVCTRQGLDLFLSKTCRRFPGRLLRLRVEEVWDAARGRHANFVRETLRGCIPIVSDSISGIYATYHDTLSGFCVKVVVGLQACKMTPIASVITLLVRAYI